MRERSSSVSIITWNRAYAIFPRLVHINRADDSLRCLIKSNDKHFKEYSKRDKKLDITYGGVEEEYLEFNKWRPVTYDGVTISSLNEMQYSYTYRKRYIGDRQTWTISFDESKVVRPQIFGCEPQTIHFGMCEAYVRDYSDGNDRGLIHKDVIVGSWVNHTYHPENQRPGRQGVESRRAYRNIQLAMYSQCQIVGMTSHSYRRHSSQFFG